MMIRGEGAQRLFMRLGEKSVEGVRMRNRVGSVAAVVVVFFGLLVALGQGALVLAVLVAAAIVLAVVAAALFVRERNGWLRMRLRQLAPVARALTASGRRSLGTYRIRLVCRGRAAIGALAALTARRAPAWPQRSTADDPPTVELALWPVRGALAEEFPDLSAGDEHVTEPAEAAEGTPGSSGGEPGLEPEPAHESVAAAADQRDEAEAAGGNGGADSMKARSAPLAVAPASARPRPLLRALERWIGQQARRAGLAPATRTAPLPEHARLANRLARSRTALGIQLRRVGEPAQAAEQHRTARALYATAGNVRGEALATNSLGLALADAGDDQAALEAFEQARALLHALGDDEHEGQVLANIGVAKHRVGAAEEAARLLESALAKLEPETPAYRLVERHLRRAS